MALDSIDNKFVEKPIDKARGNASKDEVINSSKQDLKSEFDIDNIIIAMDNRCLHNIFCLPKLKKIHTETRFIIASPKLSIQPLVTAITSAF